MGRPRRTIDDGLVYHALNRGNNRASVFGDYDDYLAFLQALANTKERYPFRLLGYCLMTNHFHLLLRPERGQSISRILQSLTVAHTWRYHKRHRSSGHVWQSRFKSPVIQDEMHLLVVLRYIEANPLRARMVADLDDLDRSGLFDVSSTHPQSFSPCRSAASVDYSILAPAVLSHGVIHRGAQRKGRAS
jgi:putative transposase